MKKYFSRNAIALLITVIFIMLISVSVGVGLKYINKTATGVNNAEFIYQSSIVLDDVLSILRSSKEIEAIDSAEKFAIFLAESAFIPFSSSGIDVVIEISSARSKVNPSIFQSKEQKEAFEIFLTNKMVSLDFAYILYDAQGGIKVDGSYNTDMFDENPYLFRDYIFSKKHLKEIKAIYEKKYHDNSVNYIDLEELFYTAKNKTLNYIIDVNQATALTWEVMLGCSENRALFLSENQVLVSKVEDLALSDEERSLLKRFNTSFYEPHIEVKVKVSQRDMQANINFEYNLSTKKGSNFVLEV